MNIVQKFDLPKTVMLIGMMGAGKTTVGKHLAKHFHAPFVDADAEIERASGLSVKELYRKYGEDEFYKGEERVVTRLLVNNERYILSSGGTAFISPKVRELSKEKALTVWLKVDYDLLYSRTKGRKHRPMIPSDHPEHVLRNLIEEYYPIYANADIIIDIKNESPKHTCNRIAMAIKDYFSEEVFA